MKIGVVGLGKMGANIALNLLDQGVEVVGYDIDNNSRMLASKQGISVVSSIQSLVSELPKRKVIWLMVPNGNPTENAIDSLKDLLTNEDIIIDAGNSNYNATGDYDSEDYFIGKTMIVCTYSYFDFVQISENNYAFKLKQSFIDYLNLPQNKNKIVLKIEINLDDLNNLGYIFVGFTEDSGLSNFEILECYTLETIDNELIKTVVDYE